MKLSVHAAAVRVLGTAILLGHLAMLGSCSIANSSTPAAHEAASATARSYIVEATSVDTAARAVTAAGGEVVSRLNVIDAVEARLTDAQRASVQKSDGIRQISSNAAVATQAAANVRDNFELNSLANNDGTHRWYGNWVEQNDDNSPDGGYIMIGWSDRG